MLKKQNKLKPQGKKQGNSATQQWVWFKKEIRKSYTLKLNYLKKTKLGVGLEARMDSKTH